MLDPERDRGADETGVEEQVAEQISGAPLPRTDHPLERPQVRVAESAQAPDALLVDLRGEPPELMARARPDE